MDECDYCGKASNHLVGIDYDSHSGVYAAYVCGECLSKLDACQYCGTPRIAPNFAYHLCIPSCRPTRVVADASPQSAEEKHE